MVAPAMTRAAALTVTALAAFGVSACGGGERQDADEPEGSYRLEIVDAKFPREQTIAERTTLTMVVRNADTKRVPNIAVTLETQAPEAGGAPNAFAQSTDDVGLSDPNRPVWILDTGPKGGETAYTNTWALGPMAAGQTRTFEWRVTAVKAGDYTIDYAVAPGLDGKAKIAGGGTGSFQVTVDDTPPEARVDDDNRVVRTKSR
jgi:hypothetical protein